MQAQGLGGHTAGQPFGGGGEGEGGGGDGEGGGGVGGGGDGEGGGGDGGDGGGGEALQQLLPIRAKLDTRIGQWLV